MCKIRSAFALWFALHRNKARNQKNNDYLPLKIKGSYDFIATKRKVTFLTLIALSLIFSLDPETSKKAFMCNLFLMSI